MTRPWIASVALVLAGCNVPPANLPPCELAGMPLEPASGQLGLSHCTCPAGLSPRVRADVEGLFETSTERAQVLFCLPDEISTAPCFEGGAQPLADAAGITEGMRGRIFVDEACLAPESCLELLATIGADTGCVYADGSSVESAVVVPSGEACDALRADGLCDAACGCVSGRCFGLSEQSVKGVCADRDLACLSGCEIDQRCVAPRVGGRELGRCADSARCEALVAGNERWACL